MRGTQAKRIRRKVYGDMALERAEDRKYNKLRPRLIMQNFLDEEGKPKKRQVIITGQIISIGLRHYYQAAKRRFKNGTRN